MSMDLDTQHFGEDGEYGTPKPRPKSWILPGKVGTLAENQYGKVFFLTDKGWVGISGHYFYPELGSGPFKIIHEGTEDPQ